MRKVLSQAARFGSGGLVLAGLLGVPVAAWLGPYLAMGLAIWSGQTTEPALPALPFPWWALLPALLAWLFGMVRVQEGAWGVVLVQGGGAVVALLPWVHLWRLWGIAAA